MKLLRLTAAAPELPPAADASAATVKTKRFGKKLYAAIAVIAIVIIAVAFFIPQGTTATIPLKVDYVVGEKMVYDNAMTMSLGTGSSLNLPSQSPTNITMDSTQTIEVVGFDGENYLLNHTYSMNVLNRPITYTITEKMNKTGYSTYLLNLGNTQTEVSPTGISSNSYLAQLLSRPEVKVGDSISVPYPAPNSTSNIQTTGSLNVKFNGIEDLTVPAGTYRVFRIDITSDNLKMVINTPASAQSVLTPSNLSFNMDINYQIYLEYGTLRQIKATLQESTGYQSSLLNMTAVVSMDMTLTQHIKP